MVHSVAFGWLVRHLGLAVTFQNGAHPVDGMTYGLAETFGDVRGVQC